MVLTIELYWSFRSPYSYIVLPRILELQRRYYVMIDLRIVHPAAIRNPGYFARMNPLARPYFVMDSARRAAFHGMRFRRPVPDPVGCRRWSSPALRPLGLAPQAERPH